MQKQYYGYNEFKFDVDELCVNFENETFEAIVGIARGGLTLTHFLATKLNLRDVFTINSISYDDMTKNSDTKIFNIPDLYKYKKILLVDDIVDSGETISNILEVFKDKFPNLECKVACLFYKKTAVIQPDFMVKEATAWIEFFWEVD
ncbi:MAG: phosphoribosyltransferase [Arcobacter sp.]|nr:phosphoribosyltransferase [Arcobacter sp.]